MHLRNIKLFPMLLIVFCLAVSDGIAQDKGKQKSLPRFCSNSNLSDNNKISVKEIREITIPVPRLLTVDSLQHGSIFIKKKNRSDVLMRVCIIAAGTTEEEAHAFVKNIRIEINSIVKAANTPRNDWMVSYEIYVPPSINLKLISTKRGHQNNGI